MHRDEDQIGLARTELYRLQTSCNLSDKNTFDRHQRVIDTWDPEIRDIASTMHMPVPGNCATGVLPLSEINAVAQRCRGGEAYVIGVNEGLFYFVEAMAHICAPYFPFTADPKAALMKDPNGCRLFAALLHSLAGFAEQSPLADLEPSNDQQVFTETMGLVMVFYVVAHEYAHVMHGHHEKLNDSRRRIPAGAQLELDEIPLSQRMEFEADLTGLLTTLAFSDRKGNRLALPLWAADFYFVAITFWEQFITEVIRPVAQVLRDAAIRQGLDIIMPRSLPPSETHPPTPVRKAMLRAAMICMAEGKPTKDLTIGDALRRKPPRNTELDHAYSMADRSTSFIAALWQLAKEDFSNLMQTSLTQKRETKGAV